MNKIKWAPHANNGAANMIELDPIPSISPIFSAGKEKLVIRSNNSFPLPLPSPFAITKHHPPHKPSSSTLSTNHEGTNARNSQILMVYKSIWMLEISKSICMSTTPKTLTSQIKKYPNWFVCQKRPNRFKQERKKKSKKHESGKNMSKSGWRYALERLRENEGFYYLSALKYH